MMKTRAMKGGCLKGLVKSKKGGCKVGKKRKAKQQKTHRMPDGTVMSGAKHSKSSKTIGKRNIYGY